MFIIVDVFCCFWSISHLRFLLITVLLFHCSVAKSQESISAYYDKCLSQKDKIFILGMADTLYAKAQNDAHWQCRALQLRLDYYYLQADEKNLLKEFQRLCKVALGSSTEKQAVFYAWNRVVAYYYNIHDYVAADNELKLMYEEALRQKNAYGISRYHIVTAIGYLQRNLSRKAIEELELCVKEIKERNLKADLSYPYTLLGQNYDNIGEKEKAIECLNLSLKYANNDQRLVPMLYLFYMYAKKGEIDKATPLKNELMMPGNQAILLSNSLNVFHQGLTHYYIHTNQPDSAYFYLQKVPGTASREELAAQFYESQQDYEKAFKSYYRYSNQRDSLFKLDTDQQLNIYLNRLEERDEFLERNRIREQELQMRAEREERELELLQLESAERELRIKNQEIRNEHQRQQQELESLNQQQLSLSSQAKWREEHARQLSYTIVMVGMLIFALLLIGYLIWRYFNAQKLKKEKQMAEEATQRANQTNLMKSMFLQNMNHEIRAPLAAVVGFSNLLNNAEEHDITPEERAEMMRDIQVNTDLLLTLIDDIIDLTALQSGSYQMESSVFSLSELCRTAIASVHPEITDGVELLLQVPEKDMLVKSDHKRLLQVLLNLLGNANKYTSEGSITLAFKRCADGVEISVADTGVGIPKEKAEQVFQRFEKIGSIKKGFGLGLSVCQSIVTRMGGKIWVDTTYTKGARIVFVLPLKDAEL